MHLLVKKGILTLPKCTVER